MALVQHVEIGPHHDLWMRGARTGIVQRVIRGKDGREILVLKMDHPQVRKPVRVYADDVTYL